MRRILLSGTVALALCAALSPSRAMSESATKTETVMSRQDVEELTTSSAGVVVPLLLFAAILGIMLAGSGGGNVTCEPYC
jgi:hypothetical protein